MIEKMALNNIRELFQLFSLSNTHAKIYLPVIILTAYYSSDEINPSHNLWKFKSSIYLLRVDDWIK